MRFGVTKTSFDPGQRRRAVGMLDPTSDNRSKQDLGYVGDRREALSVTPNWRKNQPKHRGNDKNGCGARYEHLCDDDCTTNRGWLVA